MICKLVCKECGNTFINTNERYNKKYCSDKCKLEHSRRIKEWNKKLKEKEAEKKVTIDEVVQQARKKHVTYGQIVAEETKKNVRLKKHGLKEGYRLAKDDKRD